MIENATKVSPRVLKKAELILTGFYGGQMQVHHHLTLAVNFPISIFTYWVKKVKRGTVKVKCNTPPWPGA